MTSLAGIERFRKSEYTGENRCMACTVTNVVIAALLSGSIAILYPIAGLMVFALCLLAIYLRGYLVPYTPILTRRYFPERVLDFFDAPHADPNAPGTEGNSLRRPNRESPDPDVDLETLLVSIDVVEPCESEDDLCLTPAFRDDLLAETERLRDDEEEIRRAAASLIETSPDSVTIRDGRVRVYVVNDRRSVGQWESLAALIADLAAARVFEKRWEEWDVTDFQTKNALLGGLRIFLETCPACGGRVEAQERTVESCCRSRELIESSCVECEMTLFSMPQDALAEAE